MKKISNKFYHGAVTEDRKQFQCLNIVLETTNLDHYSCNVTGHFRVPPGLCFKTRVDAQPLIWKSFVILMHVKLICTKKGCAPSLILKVRVFGTRKWPIDAKTHFSFSKRKQIV